MTHIDYWERLRQQDGETPEEWLPALARLTEYLNKISLRSDLSVTFTAGADVPACFLPHRGEIRIDTGICLPGVDPGTVDPSDSLWNLEHPVFMGAGGHEGAHAAHTRWTVADFERHGATAKELDVILTLEESRCEARMLSRLPGQRPYLRAAALDIIMKDFQLPRTVYGAAGAAALVLGRIDGRTLQASDGRAVREEVEQVLGRDVLDGLRQLWQRFLAAGDNDLPTMLITARDWLRLLEEDPEDGTDLLFRPDEQGAEAGDLSEVMGEAAVEADAALVEKRAEERQKRSTAAAQADAHRRLEGAEAASEAFSGTVESRRSAAGLCGERPATVEEQRAATELAAQLLEAETPPERADVERSARQRPPGRLRTRAAQQSAAYRDLGIRSRPEMFVAREVRPEVRTPLTIGLLLDVSGSMATAEEALSSTHWVVSHAGARIGARVAAIHFGTAVHGVARPGQLDEKVQRYTAGDPWENITDAFLAVDHELGLLDGRGARLLVIASDGFFRRATEVEFARSAMALCKERGVGVLWLQCTPRHVTTHGHGAIVDLVDKPPVQAAKAVGAAAIARLR